MTKTLLSFLVAMIMVGTAHAQLGGADTKPGDSCGAAEEGYIRRNASADRDVSEITLICDGSQWQSAQLAPGLPSLNSSQIWVGSGSNAATAVTMSGDATLSNAGVLNIANDALLGPEISAGSITNSHLAGSIALSKIAITGTADGSKFLRDDGSWQAPSETDPQIDAVTSNKWCRGTGSQVTCDQDAPSGGGLAAPPVCNLSNRALQWDGTNWSCVIIAGSGGPPIVNGDHTQQECVDAGGTINTTEFGGDIVCAFSGNGCPGGWTTYGLWKRNAKTCSGECSTTNWTCTLPAGWINTNGSRSCSYSPSLSAGACYPRPLVNCTQAAGEGVTNTACY